MIRVSASSGMLRGESLLRKRCARVALSLILLFTFVTDTARSQSPSAKVPALEQTAAANGPAVVAAAEAPAVTPPQVASTPAAPAVPPQSGAAATLDAKPKPKAPPRVSDDPSVALERTGTLNLHGLSLNAALFTIGEQWNVNVVAGELEGKVNGVFNDAPLREILDSILLSNGYNYRIVGKSIVVSSIEDLGQVNPFFQSATIPVKSADIDEVVEGAKLLTTPKGQVRALKSAHSIVVLDFPDRVNMIREFVATLDGASSGRMGGPAGRSMLEVAYFRTQFIKATTAADALVPVLSKDGKVGVLEKEDRLLVTDYPENLAMIEKVLERTDQPRPQVRITALIYDISLEDIERLGLNWNAIGYTSTEGQGINVATSTAPFGGAIDAISPGPGNFAIGALTRHFDIQSVCQALQQAKDARLLADPNVAVLENEQAIFRSVREIPIQQLTETQQGGNIGTTAFRDAGITLTVTPKIACDNTISMIVAPEFSRHVGNDDNGQPIIDTRKAETTLRIANRQTVVIGGLRQRDDIGDFSGVPYLKDLRIVGRLFRQRNTTVRESELVVFLMPEIIDAADKPSYRQQMVEETVRCRLDNIPEAEGCPPGCRRLPPQIMEGEFVEPTPSESELPIDAAAGAATKAMPPIQQPNDLPAMSAQNIPAAELQFGVAGRSEQVRTLIAEGRLRRLPTVDSPAAATDAGQIETANAQTAETIVQ